jgi:hypothetical protein
MSRRKKRIPLRPPTTVSPGAAIAKSVNSALRVSFPSVVGQPYPGGITFGPSAAASALAEEVAAAATARRCPECGVPHQVLSAKSGRVPKEHLGSAACVADRTARELFMEGLAPFPGTCSVHPTVIVEVGRRTTAATPILQRIHPNVVLGGERQMRDCNLPADLGWPTRACVGLDNLGEVDTHVSTPVTRWQIWMPLWVRIVTELWSPSAQRNHSGLVFVREGPGGAIVVATHGATWRRDKMLSELVVNPEGAAAVAAAWRLSGDEGAVAVLASLNLLDSVLVPPALAPKETP